MSDTDIERYQRPPIANVLSRTGVDTSEQPWRDTPSGWRRGPCAICRSGNKRAFAYREDSGRWRCFECGAGGNVWDLVMALEGCDFDAALALWRTPAESPEVPDSDSDLIQHDISAPTGNLSCPACSEMFRSGMGAPAIVAAHENAQAGSR
jgi:hypothetical protein